ARQTGGMVPAGEGSTLISAMAVGELVAVMLERLSSIPVAGSLLMIAVTAAVVLVCRKIDREKE
ncbi:MAG: hypothetical protein J6Q99_02840, partial [Oscillospiraceae bacterium]|nr:hypothetical protein [Oscillospiraceae bacterium]